MKKFIFLLLLTPLLALGVQALLPGNMAEAAVKPVVYFVPHQDDETISMSSDIAAHIAANRPVYVVLVTDGSASSARGPLCTTKKVCLSEAQFSAARTREFVAALSQLGVTASHIFYENVVDDTLTSPQAEAIIDKYIAKYPGASYKTMSWLDKHNDHYRLGYALNNRCVYQNLDCRFLQSPLYQKGVSFATFPVVSPISGRYNNTAKTRAAVAEYRYWNPSIGRYAIGDLSVKSQLDYTYNNHYSQYHMNNSNWNSTADRLSAASWISASQK